MSQDNEVSNIDRDLRRMETSPTKPTFVEWSDMHRRIVQLPRSDRRQLYRDKEYVPLEEVLNWQQTCFLDKRITDAGTNSEEDIRIAFEINKRVAICRKRPQTIECDAVLLDLSSDWDYNAPVGRFTIFRGCRDPANYAYIPNMFVNVDDYEIEFLTLATRSGCRSLVIGFGRITFAGEDDPDTIISNVKEWLEQNYDLVDKIIFCTYEDSRYNELTETMLTHFPVYKVNIPESKLPVEILRMDSRSIEIFKKALSDGKHVVHNIRVMLVGHSGVGKTTILKRLLGQKVDIDKRESTDGIEVHVHRCKVDIDSGQWTLCEDGAPDPSKVLASTMLSVSADKSVQPSVRESSPQPGTSRDDHTEVTYTQKQNVSSRSESDTDEPLSKKAKLEVGASSEAPSSACGSSSTFIEDSTKGNETQLAQKLKC